MIGQPLLSGPSSGPLGPPHARHIFVGDVHGCLDELVELLTSLRVTPRDVVVLLGDLLDRGPDPAAVVRYARAHEFLCVVGNHEDKALRYRAHELAGRAPNPVSVLPERLAQWQQLGPEDWTWLEAQPRWRFGPVQGNAWAAVHGGFETSKGVGTQDGRVVPYVRKVSSEGLWKRGTGESQQWAKVWAQPVCVAYGHEIFPEVMVDRPGTPSACYGLDTGCFRGGKLSAAEVVGGQVYLSSVPSRQVVT